MKNIGLENNSEVDLVTAQKIFGFFDKSNLIELLKYLLHGKEKQVIDIYRSIYDQGVEPKVFLNDFLEILYYLKNINYLKIEGKNFDLNDAEFKIIEELSNTLTNETLLLFWQFTIKTIEEIEIVSNQHIAIEMFLIRLMHLKSISSAETKGVIESELNEEITNKVLEDKELKNNKINDDLYDSKNKTIGQIKNVIQEKKK